jgi:4-amino-4-deoxy-L-arabinose transferase-like glycosyltransferase
MPKRTQLFWLVLILLLAAVLRLTGIDWDDYNHYHPDERYIAWVATSVEWPADLGSALKPHESTINPFYWPDGVESPGIVLDQGEPRRFAYGHLPLYLGVVFTRLMEWLGPSLAPRLPESWLLTQDVLNGAGWIEFRHITAAGRALTALFDLGTVVLVYLLGRALFNPAVGLLAAAFLAVNVMHIQLAHFFTADPYLTFFVVLAMLFLVLATRLLPGDRRRPILILLAAVAIGLAVGSKFSAVLLLLPLAVAVFLDSGRSPWRRSLWFLAGLLLAGLTFALTNPFAILDWTCQAITPAVTLGPVRIPALSWGSCYLENVVLQGTMVRGVRDVPFVRQYAGTTPYLYFIEMQLRWGMGPLLGLAAFTGFGWVLFLAAGRVIRNLNMRRAERQDSLNGMIAAIGRPELVVLAWTVPFFVTTGGLYVKFMRYLQPLTPFLMIFAAAVLLHLPRPLWRRVAVGLVLLLTGLYAWGFVNIYSASHPWVAASVWIYDNLPASRLILSEAWDDPLPDTITADGQRMSRIRYRTDTLNWLSGTGAADSPQKLAENLELLAQADYVVLSSNRNYGVIPRLPERYPLSGQYYQLLLDGRLGFEVIYAGSRVPNWLGVHLKPDTFGWPGLPVPDPVQAYLGDLWGPNWGRADESFTVYDQPLAIILENKARLSAAEMTALFDTP